MQYRSDINESTVHGFKKAYELRSKRLEKMQEEEDLTVTGIFYTATA